MSVWLFGWAIGTAAMFGVLLQNALDDDAGHGAWVWLIVPLAVVAACWPAVAAWCLVRLCWRKAKRV